MKNKKVQKETDIHTDLDTYMDNKYEIDGQLDDKEDSLHLTKPVEENENESKSVTIDEMLSSMGLNSRNLNEGVRNDIKRETKDFVDYLKTKYGIKEDTEKDSRSVEYGIDPEAGADDYEEYDKLVNDLNKSKVNENINPRIKKGDLLNIITTKNGKRRK